MRFTILTTLVLLTSWASAAPFLPLRPVPISASPLYQDPLLFPTIFAGARYVGYFLSPALQSTIGQENVQRLDTIINQSCFAALDSKRDSKTCQNLLAKLDKLAIQTTPLKKSQHYRELLSAACMTSVFNPPIDSCQPLLADADCFTHGAFDIPIIKKWRFLKRF